jgi:hypothetical protein
MKSLILFFITIFSQFTIAQHQHDPASVHGMLLFGKKNFYFSHLPMFHKPHDYQVIFEVEMSEEAMLAYQKSLEEDLEETVYTIVPEKFILPEMVKNPKIFKFDLFKGHFERGGSFLIGGTAMIKEIHFFKKFSKDLNQVKNQYIIIGKQGEYFLVHEITTKPDFDLVAEISIPSNMIVVSGQKLKLAENFIDSVLPEEVFKMQEFEFTFHKKLYLETQDLSF